MKKVCIIQARMGSSRLPGKVLKVVAGEPMLVQQIARLQQCRNIDEIVVATTDNPVDEPIVELLRAKGLRWFCGDEEDVLKRYVDAANDAQADVIIRITADCPLIDPQVTDKVVEDLVGNPSQGDYASNVLPRTYPRGLDVEVFFWDTLLRMDRLACSQTAREHVTIVPRSECPELFLLRSVTDTEDNSDLRWTVDTEADLQLVRALYEQLDLAGSFVEYREVIEYVRSQPSLRRLNEGVKTWSPD
jgi:spore coat polysaccharide biosynthesis protein SpsF